MLATSTHDTKRSEDVRARIACLSEFPDRWRHYLGRWSRLNKTHRRQVDDQPAPTRNDEFLLYQTLLGAWPDSDCGPVPSPEFVERVASYMTKAAREAKLRTSWIAPNDAYEQALTGFVRDILDQRRPGAFLRDLQELREPVAWFGMLNSLSQVLLKLTSPGIPDIYQGMELPEHSLVDPDNRRSVDFERREAMLAELEQLWRDPLARAALAGELLANWSDGRLKLFITWRTLAVRAELPDVFRRGSYEPLQVTGTHAEHVIAFRRVHGSDEAIVVAPARMARLVGGHLEAPLGTRGWQDTRIEWPTDGRVRVLEDAYTGNAIRTEEHRKPKGLSVGDLLQVLPLSMLTTNESRPVQD